MISKLSDGQDTPTRREFRNELPNSEMQRGENGSSGSRTDVDPKEMDGAEVGELGSRHMGELDDNSRFEMGNYQPTSPQELEGSFVGPGITSELPAETKTTTAKVPELKSD